MTISGAYNTAECLFEEGVIIGNTPYYHEKDHLGSVRVVLNHLGVETGLKYYFPFGKPDRAGSYTSATDRYHFNGKENSYFIANNYLLDYGARLYDPGLGRWLQQDPLAEVNFSISPYAFSSNNPVNRVDRDGRLDDWYLNETGGDLVWRPSQATTITENGKTYNNIGSTVSVANQDGTFSNYYQNAGFRSTSSFNALDHILDNGLAGQYLSRSSGLWEQGQQDLMKASIHRGHEDFLVGATLVGSKMLQKGGDMIATVGYGATASGIGAEAGVPLVTLGNVMKYTGLGIESLVDFRRGNYNKIIYNGTTNTLMYGVGRLGKYFPGPVGATYNLILTPFNQALDYGADRMPHQNQKK